MQSVSGNLGAAWEKRGQWWKRLCLAYGIFLLHAASSLSAWSALEDQANTGPAFIAGQSVNPSGHGFQVEFRTSAMLSLHMQLWSMMRNRDSDVPQEYMPAVQTLKLMELDAYSSVLLPDFARAVMVLEDTGNVDLACLGITEYYQIDGVSRPVRHLCKRYLRQILKVAECYIAGAWASDRHALCSAIQLVEDVLPPNDDEWQRLSMQINAIVDDGVYVPIYFVNHIPDYLGFTAESNSGVFCVIGVNRWEFLLELLLHEILHAYDMLSISESLPEECRSMCGGARDAIEEEVAHMVIAAEAQRALKELIGPGHMTLDPIDAGISAGRPPWLDEDRWMELLTTATVAFDMWRQDCDRDAKLEVISALIGC